MSLSTLLSASQQTSLRVGKIQSKSDILLVAPTEIAKKCKIALTEAQSIIDIVCRAHVREPRSLWSIQLDEVFTTGDTALDYALGGGIRTGMLWEVVGQSAAGKTQCGLQLSLTVQLPKTMGGISGSACYLTTSAKLPTTRLLELAKARQLLSPSLCSLSDVQTMLTPNIPLLTHVLSDLLPKLIVDHSRPPAKPIKLLVIDALAELFHSSDKTTTQTLVQRSRNIYEISSLLHSLASRYRLAILVLNEVGDAFDRRYNTADSSPDLIYNDQSRLFGRADSVPGESSKEASLGLVWANQVNVRIMLNRTGRRRHLDEVRFAGNKLQKINSEFASGSHVGVIEENATLIRRMSVIFSSVAPPLSLDYIVTIKGVSVLPDGSVSREVQQMYPVLQLPAARIPMVASTVNPEALSQVSPLDVGCAEDEGAKSSAGELLQTDEWDAYWENDEQDAYNNVDLDGLLANLNAQNH